MVLTSISGFSGHGSQTDPSQWNVRQIDEWFDKGEWLNGWQVKPDKSINRKLFLVSYFKNKELWDKAFTFLKDVRFSDIEIKRYDIEGEKVYAVVNDYLSKNEEDAQYESHRKYIDIQYVIKGSELIGIAPITSKKDILVPYDTTKDIEFMTVTQGKNYRATPDNFFIFFPDDAHRPGLKDGENSPVRKIVVKVMIK